MKQPDFEPCAICREGILHDRIPVFYRLTIETMVAKVDVIKRQFGFELMMGDHAALAYHMGTQEDMATPLEEGTTLLLCQRCALHEGSKLLVAVEEKAAKTTEKDGK